MSGTESSKRIWDTVSRVVYPVHDADEISPLYVTLWTRPVFNEATFNTDARRKNLRLNRLNEAQFERIIRHGVVTAGNVSRTTSDFHIDSRTQLTVNPEGHVSLCTFFNAFPGGYWRRWTKVRTVRFSAQVRGTGTLTLFRSTGRGLFSPVSSLDIDTETPRTISAEVPLVNMMDGGYVWFDAHASGISSLTVDQASWQVPMEQRTTAHTQPTTLSIAITTFNRPTYCLNQLKTISADNGLRKRLDTIYCTDQGNDWVENQPDFDATAHELGSQLTYLHQRNLGGSGGFSRGMYETVKKASSDYVLLLDDDAISEPEAILRSMQFADYTTRPTLVGGGMFHLDNRTILYTQGERLNPATFWMQPSQGLGYNHDFAAAPLRDSPERHRRVDTDFNGWWMCLIPVTVIKEIGLSLPTFIKFDDTEYSLRAKEHGFPTVCLPGVAVWHQAWHDKDPARTWEEYFFQRNRWICALLHSPKPAPRFLIEILYGDLNVGMRLLYSALELHNLGLRDILSGPENIINSMPTKLTQVREVRANFDDARSSDDFDSFPEPENPIASRVTPRSGINRVVNGAKAVVSALLSRSNGTDDVNPQISISSNDEMWEAFQGVESALVTSPDGNSVAWLKRDNDLFRTQMKEAVGLAKRLVGNWEELSEQYRSADMASMATWARFFEKAKAPFKETK